MDGDHDFRIAGAVAGNVPGELMHIVHPLHFVLQRRRATHAGTQRDAEIVIPIHKNGKLVGVLDLDSPLKNRFTEEDEAGLKKIVAALEEIAEFKD